MSLKECFNWCKENYKLLLAIGALLLIINYILEIINRVGITINIPKYFEYFGTLELSAQMYTLAGANFVFTIVFVLLIASGKKPPEKESKKK